MASFYTGQTDYIDRLNELTTAAYTEAALASIKDSQQTILNLTTETLLNTDLAEGYSLDAAASLAAVNLVFDTFDDRFLGVKTSDPTLDNDGNALLAGTVYYNSTSKQVKFYNGATWDSPAASATASATSAATSASTATAKAVIATDKADIATTKAAEAVVSAATAVTATVSKANIASPTFSGTVTLPNVILTGTVTGNNTIFNGIVVDCGQY